MDPRIVEKLKERISDAVARFIVDMGLKRLPLLPTQRTILLMAKAAVAAYEAAVENHDLPRTVKQARED